MTASPNLNCTPYADDLYSISSSISSIWLSEYVGSAHLRTLKSACCVGSPLPADIDGPICATARKASEPAASSTTRMATVRRVLTIIALLYRLLPGIPDQL